MPIENMNSKLEPLEAPRLGEPYLLTPGPLTTAYEVKEAMLRDWGSWDGDFRAMTAELRRELLDIAGDKQGEFDCVPMQGSGSFSVEALLGSFVPRDGKALVLINGAYGKRIAQTLGYLGRNHVVIDKGDYMPPGERRLQPLSMPMRASRTSSSSTAKRAPAFSIRSRKYRMPYIPEGRKLLVDSMSAFGAVPAGIADFRYEAIVSSANKCIEGVPGFGFIIARKSELEAAKAAAIRCALTSMPSGTP